MTDTHVKMPDVTPVVRYTANGIQSIFEYGFPIFASEDLRVFFDGVEKPTGYTLTGTNETNGGTVVFDAPPPIGVVVTLLRSVPYERYTDFLESGEFSVRSLNNELDYLTASIQQLSRDQEATLKYSLYEEPSFQPLPNKSIRANRALGFDGNGDPTIMDANIIQQSPNFTAVGFGAVTRTTHNKLSDFISIKDFGAIGDGITDDTLAFGKALMAHDYVFVPSGTYRITDTIELAEGKILQGSGQSSILRSDNNLFTVVHVCGGHNALNDFVIDGGDIGLNLQGTIAPCIHNRVTNIIIQNADVGIVLDGGNDHTKTSSLNIIRNCIIKSPNEMGILFSKSGAGTSPFGNIIDGCSINYNGVNMSDHGIYVQYGDGYNRIINCDVIVSGMAQSCVTIGANAIQTIVQNISCHSSNNVPNIVLKFGSQNTHICNLLAYSNGAAIDDQSGGLFEVINAGFPINNRLDKLQSKDFTATLMRQDTVFIEDAGTATYSLNTEKSVHLVSAYNGKITIELPLASDVPAATYLIKKIDQTGNPVVVSETNGLGIDRKSEIILGGPYDYLAIISNGAEWHITSSNRMAGNTQFSETGGVIDIDMSVDTYLMSAYVGTVTCRLPPANAAKAIGRTITIKKTDSTSNSVIVSEQGGNGPDNTTQTLISQYAAITIVSNGAAWHVISKI
jgi:hypothetical protein